MNNTTTQKITNETEYTLATSELLSEIKLLLKDNYVATFEDGETELTMRFLNGQKFKLKLQEEL